MPEPFPTLYNEPEEGTQGASSSYGNASENTLQADLESQAINSKAFITYYDTHNEEDEEELYRQAAIKEGSDVAGKENPPVDQDTPMAGLVITTAEQEQELINDIIAANPGQFANNNDIKLPDTSQNFIPVSVPVQTKPDEKIFVRDIDTGVENEELKKLTDKDKAVIELTSPKEPTNNDLVVALDALITSAQKTKSIKVAKLALTDLNKPILEDIIVSPNTTSYKGARVNEYLSTVNCNPGNVPWGTGAVATWWKEAGAELPSGKSKANKKFLLNAAPSWLTWAQESNRFAETPDIGTIAVYGTKKIKNKKTIMIATELAIVVGQKVTDANTTIIEVVKTKNVILNKYPIDADPIVPTGPAKDPRIAENIAKISLQWGGAKKERFGIIKPETTDFDSLAKAIVSIEGGYGHPAHFLKFPIVPANYNSPAWLIGKPDIDYTMFNNSGETLWGMDRYAGGAARKSGEQGRLGKLFWSTVDKYSGFGQWGSIATSSAPWKDGKQTLDADGRNCRWLHANIPPGGTRPNPRGSWTYPGTWNHGHNPALNQGSDELWKTLGTYMAENYKLMTEGYFGPKIENGKYTELLTLINSDGRFKFFYYRLLWNGALFHNTAQKKLKALWDAGERDLEFLLTANLLALYLAFPAPAIDKPPIIQGSCAAVKYLTGFGASIKGKAANSPPILNSLLLTKVEVNPTSILGFIYTDPLTTK